MAAREGETHSLYKRVESTLRKNLLFQRASLIGGAIGAIAPLLLLSLWYSSTEGAVLTILILVFIILLFIRKYNLLRDISHKSTAEYIDEKYSLKARASSRVELGEIAPGDDRLKVLDSQIKAILPSDIHLPEFKLKKPALLLLSFAPFPWALLLWLIITTPHEVKNVSEVSLLEEIIAEKKGLPEKLIESLEDLRDAVSKEDLDSNEVKEALKRSEEALKEALEGEKGTAFSDEKIIDLESLQQETPTPTATPSPTIDPKVSQAPSPTPSSDSSKKESSSKDESNKKEGDKKDEGSSKGSSAQEKNEDGKEQDKKDGGQGKGGSSDNKSEGKDSKTGKGEGKSDSKQESKSLEGVGEALKEIKEKSEGSKEGKEQGEDKQDSKAPKEEGKEGEKEGESKEEKSQSKSGEGKSKENSDSKEDKREGAKEEKGGEKKDSEKGDKKESQKEEGGKDKQNAGEKGEGDKASSLPLGNEISPTPPNGDQAESDGGPKTLDEVAVPGQDETLDARFTGEEKEKVRNEKGSDSKVSLSDVKLSKPDEASAEEGQYVPPEYSGILR